MGKKRDDDTTPNNDDMQELKGAADPTMLRLTVFDFEAKTNPQGVSGKTCKKFRTDYDFCRFVQALTSACGRSIGSCKSKEGSQTLY